MVGAQHLAAQSLDGGQQLDVVARLDPVVPVQKGHVLTGRRIQAGVASSRQPGVARVGEHLDSTKLVGPLGQHG
jgi:hypothetical protein